MGISNNFQSTTCNPYGRLFLIITLAQGLKLLFLKSDLCNIWVLGTQDVITSQRTATRLPVHAEEGCPEVFVMPLGRHEHAYVAVHASSELAQRLAFRGEVVYADPERVEVNKHVVVLGAEKEAVRARHDAEYNGTDLPGHRV